METGTSLELKHGTGNDAVTIFPHNQVWYELYYKYTQWAILADPLSNPMTAFLACYTNFKANMGEGFWRMYDALERQYNPIENYSMIEAGADGHKQSKKTNTGTSDGLTGTKDADRTHKTEGKTKETGDQYAFNSPNASPVDVQTTEYGADNTEFKTTDSYTNLVSDTVDNVTMSNMEQTQKSHGKSEATEEFQDNKTLSFKKTNPDGTDTTETLGSDFTDGTMYRHTRSGNIGVTTAQAMLNEELELRKRNLLSEWCEMFIREYTTLIFDGEE